MAFSPSVAFLTGSVGTGEWVVLFVVVLIVVGPKRLPEIARKLGRTMEMFRRAADEFKDQIMNMDREPPAPSAPSDSSSSPDMAESYDNLNSDTSDYPGNEGQAGNWSSDTLSDTSSPEAPADSAGDEKPVEGGQ